MPIFCILLEGYGLHISAKFRGPIPNSESQGPIKFLNFWTVVVFDKEYGKVGYSQVNRTQCVSFEGKIRNFLPVGFCNFFPNLRYRSTNFANFAIFDFFSKFNA